MYPGYFRKPHYYETDQMGIVHHSNYIRWFEEARVDLLEYLNLPYSDLEQAGIIVPVLEVSCQYKGMIRYGENVRIDPTVIKYNGTRLDFSYEIINEKNQTVTTGTSKHCFLEAQNNQFIRLKKVQPTFHQIFTDYLGD
ncbi:acyl-CoA thioesterase [Tetragenococcus osmophilus]|uniref:4-hydroxybenzoyl-CoA thioesterase n=1 Tax=Tetragenococcus osmophilus TaxID=526944 RepID=A0AA37XML4_9ENTE|nr:acyl-CoA thioesterase [Tetragenococcus osmophilus]AYW47515.1 acyl-CoA thioesterase [Tetragenococcus osmophilus]GMA53125.1 4-hydroxybenzoyl-CoA thioesterase [Alicyclobacillus contaminans]GMA72899.1 4-hydroxybenzoyl-CoA thioesterase [Tetragenococcus osmophilus]